MAQIQTILVPVDFSRQSSEALDYALDLANTLGAQVKVLHVYDLPVYALIDGVILPPADTLAKLMNEAQEKLDALLERRYEEGVRGLTGATVSGSAPVEIVKHAKKSKADLIVMATHGYTGTRHILLGSVAERVVRTSEVPVLTVRVSDE